MNELSTTLYNLAPKELPYVEITNLGSFVASFFVSYMLDGTEEFKESGVISIFFSKKIEIPFAATKIHVLVSAYNGLGQWTPIYNNNYATSSTLKVTLRGTVLHPNFELTKDPNPSNYHIEAHNNSGVVALLLVEYNFDGKRYSIVTDEFLLGMNRTIQLPNDANNIHVALKPSSGKLRIAYANFYEKNFRTATNLELKFYGSISAETVWENGKEITEDINNIIKVVKFPDKGQVYVGQPIEFSIVITNSSKNTLTKVALAKEIIPDNAKFVANSLMVNSKTIPSTSFPDTGMSLGDLNPATTTTIRYKIVFHAIPLTTKLDHTVKEVDYTFAEEPALTYSYIDSNNTLKTNNLLGNIEEVIIRNLLDSSLSNSLNLNEESPYNQDTPYNQDALYNQDEQYDDIVTVVPLNSSNGLNGSLNDNTVFNSYENYLKFLKSIE